MLPPPPTLFLFLTVSFHSSLVPKPLKTPGLISKASNQPSVLGFLDTEFCPTCWSVSLAISCHTSSAPSCLMSPKCPNALFSYFCLSDAAFCSWDTYSYLQTTCFFTEPQTAFCCFRRWQQGAIPGCIPGDRVRAAYFLASSCFRSWKKEGLFWVCVQRSARRG